MADLTPEQNDFLSYIVQRSRRAAILDMNIVYQDYRRAGFINPDDAPNDAQLTAIFDLLLERIERLQLLPRTKAKLLFSTQNEQRFNDLFRGQFLFTEESLNAVNLRQRNEQDGPRIEYTEEEKNDWLMYVAESSRTADTPLKMHEICKQYQIDSGIPRTAETLEVQFRRIIAIWLETSNFPLLTRAKMCYATSTSVSSEFLRDLSRAQIFVDWSIKITKFKPRGYIRRAENRERISAEGQRRTVWTAEYENAMMDFLEDDASPGELNLAAVWRKFRKEYITAYENRPFHPSAKRIENHFAEKMKNKICSLVDRYDLSTLARMCIMASIPIKDEGFLQKLQQHADKNDIIFEYDRTIKDAPEFRENLEPFHMPPAADPRVNTWTEVEDNDLLGYIASRAWNGERLLINEILRTYKASSGSGREVEELQARFNNHLRARIESSQYLHLTRVKMLYATNTPISPEFRQTLTRLRINTIVNRVNLLAPEAHAAPPAPEAPPAQEAQAAPPAQAAQEAPPAQAAQAAPVAPPVLEAPPAQAAQVAPVAPPVLEAPEVPQNLADALNNIRLDGNQNH